MDLQICELNKSHSEMVKSNISASCERASNYRQAVNVQFPGTPLDTAFLVGKFPSQEIISSPLEEIQQDDEEPKKEEPKVKKIIEPKVK